MSPNIQTRKNAPLTLAAVLAQNQGKIESHLAKALDINKFLAATTMCVRKDPKLGQCTPESFMAAVEAAAVVQLLPGPTLGHAYLVPYGKECTFILGYRGMIALIRRCGAKKATARCVYENDEFEVEYGSQERLVHKPHRGADRGDFIGAYAVVTLGDGETLIEWMSEQEINAIRDRSPASRKGPWKTDYLEMARKTPLRRAFKWMPVDPGMERYQEAGIQDEYEDAGVPRDVEVEVVEGPAVDTLEELAEDMAEPKAKRKKATKKKAEAEGEPSAADVREAEDWGDSEKHSLSKHVADALTEDEAKPKPLPRFPWDEDDEFGGYPYEVNDEAATMSAWFDEKCWLGLTWREMTELPPDARERIGLATVVRASTAKWKKEGTVDALGSRAAIVEALLDARIESDG